MRRSATPFYFAHSLIISFHLQSLHVTSTEQQKFYCDVSSDALDFVPASRSCTDLAGQNRCWFTYTPDQDEQETVPLVLDLHGYTSCAQFNPSYTSWMEKSSEENFYVVWPQGTNNFQFAFLPCWNAGSCCCFSSRDIPDSDLLKQIIDETIEASNGRIDPKRVYIAGHSNGCFMSQKFVKDYPGVVAAVACHAGVMLDEHPSSADSNWVPTTIVTVHGDEDDTVSYPTTLYDLGAEDNIDLWGESNGCSKKTIILDSSNEFKTHTWSGCKNGVSNQLIQVIGGDHNPYASSGYVDTTSMAWDFIKTVLPPIEVVCSDFTKKSECEEYEACAFGKKKVRKCIPKKEKGCPKYSNEDKCVKKSVCEYVYGSCVHKCNNITDKGECKKTTRTDKTKKKICAFKKVENPCKNCHPKTCS